MIIRNLVVAVFLITQGSAFGQQKINADWIIGTWQMDTRSGPVYEEWSPVTASEFHAKSYRVRGTDTIALESIRLSYIGDKLHFVPTVAGQNNNQSVYFLLVSQSDSLLAFENINHDFPQRIQYELTAAGNLAAEISGTIKGVLRRQHYSLKKVSR